jgi:short-subunit dehydrogenase
MNAALRPLAIVTGASSGIGLGLARECAREGFDLLIAADRSMAAAEAELQGFGASVESIETDLSTPEGIDKLYAAIRGRPVAALLANAGQGRGHAFLDQEFSDIVKMIDTNITGTLALIHRVGRDMRARNQGRILLTGSIAGYMPGTFQAVYNGTKAFIDSFSWALRNELKDTAVSVTCLMPGPTDTEFFDRADMSDTKVGTGQKMDADEVAKIGFKAMMDGEGDVVAGWKNKMQVAMAAVTPSGVLAEQHRKMAEPGTGNPGKH